MIQTIAPYAKAIASAVVAFATYVTTTGFQPTEPVWWAGAIVFVGGAAGIVYAVPNKEPSK